MRLEGLVALVAGGFGAAISSSLRYTLADAEAIDFKLDLVLDRIETQSESAR